jgi:hypothetical protein
MRVLSSSEIELCCVKYSPLIPFVVWPCAGHTYRWNMQNVTPEPRSDSSPLENDRLFLLGNAQLEGGGAASKNHEYLSPHNLQQPQRRIEFRNLPQSTCIEIYDQAHHQQLKAPPQVGERSLSFALETLQTQ